jgi:hypothetical protein
MRGSLELEDRRRGFPQRCSVAWNQKAILLTHLEGVM